jgi:hypothetical protein
LSGLDVNILERQDKEGSSLYDVEAKVILEAFGREV